VLSEKLMDAAKTGEVMRVRYFGGSTPGAERQLRPIAVADGKLRALCLQSGETKSFVIEKLEEVLEGVPSAMAASFSPAPTTFPCVEKFVAYYRPDFEAQGWVVRHHQQAVSLHRTFKNGKLIQTPDIDLSFEAETYDAVFDGEQIVEANRRERSRPWIVRGKNKTTKTFTDLEKAEVGFLELARQLSPKRVP
jgi:hypothetical protein